MSVRITCVLLVLFSVSIHALSLDDFASKLIAESKPMSENISAKPRVSFAAPPSNRALESKSISGKCTDILDRANCNTATNQAGVNKSSTALSSANAATTGANGVYFNRNSNNYDQNAINNFNITDSNQTALQVYSPKLNNLSTENSLKNNVAIPLKPNNSTNISVGANNVQFNVSY